MNNRTEAKLTDLSGMQKGIERILQQAWERGRKYGQNEVRPQGDLISRSALKKACSEMVRGSNNSDFIPCPTWNNAMELIDNAPTVSLQDIYQEGYYDGHLQGYTKAINGSQGKFECRIKIKDLIAMLLEFDMNEKATICTTDEYGENNIVISITDMRGKEE